MKLLGNYWCLITLVSLSACDARPVISGETLTLIDGGIRTSSTGAQIRKDCDLALNLAGAELADLEVQKGIATVDAVFGQYEKIIDALTPVGDVWYLRSVHPLDSVRESSNACAERVSDFYSMLALSRPLFNRISAIDVSQIDDPVEQHMVQEVVSDFRRSGVDRDDATREHIRLLKSEITAIGNLFDKNIREDVRVVKVKRSRLIGLPQDYLDSHIVDNEGFVTITTDYPDLYPVMAYAEDDDLRRELRIAARSRGYPQNVDLLQRLIKKRHDLATILGYETFADLSMANQMIGSPANAQTFLDSISEALETPVKRELAVMLARLREDYPEIEAVEVWQAAYVQNLLRKEKFALDSQELRRYFQYQRVRDGIFQLTEDLFQVDIEAWETEKWHEDVESYEIREDNKLIGRFYMDNHPRPNKYQHAAHWTLRTGIKDKQIPLSGLAQNFPKGLMEHSQVETFLHEFGHLLHNMFSGTQRWSLTAGMTMERDFVEAPSQMLEEWIWDFDTISKFAVDDLGQTIPRALVDRMSDARYFGRSTATATQIFYANLSLNYYNRNPSSFDPEGLMLELQKKYAPYPHLAGTHLYANFGHLNGYSSNYYTYQWSLAIATDLFSRFKESGLHDTEVANEYRRIVLQSAGSKPAAQFVAEFLGRDFNTDAYIKSLEDLD